MVKTVKLLSSTPRTATTTSTKQINRKYKSIVLFINCSAIAATPSVVFNVRGYDPVSGNSYVILASAAITGTGLTVLRISQGMLAAANVKADDLLPSQWDVYAVHADTDSITYSVTADLYEN